MPKKHTLPEALAMVTELNLDAAHLCAISRPSPTMRRATARAVFATIEAWAHLLRQLAIVTALNEKRMMEAMAFAEESFILDDKAELKRVRRDIRLTTVLRVASK